MVRRAIQQQGTEEPQEPHARVDLSSKYQWQGEIYGRLAEWQNAAESQRMAGLISEAVWRENPTEIQALRNTSHSHKTLGEALEHLADYQGALDSYRFSLLVIEEARAKDPASNELTYGSAYYMFRVGTALQRVGEPASALEMVRQGLTLFRQRYFVELRAYNIRQGSDFLQQVADFFASIGYRNEALATYNELIPRFEELCKPPQNDAASLGTLAGYYGSVGNIHAGFNPQMKILTPDNRGDFIEAIRWYQKALDTLRVQRELLQAPGYGPAFRSRNESASKAIEEKLDQCNRKIAGATE